MPTPVAALEHALPALRPHKTDRPVDWPALTDALGTGLPSDFRSLAENYPPFTIDDFLVVPLPAPGREHRFAAGIRDALLPLQDLWETGDSAGYAPYPQPGGLLPFATSLSGGHFHWRTTGGDPDQWPVVVATRDDAWWEHPGGALTFLAGLIDGSIPRKGLPAAGPTPNPTIHVHHL
jgi:hypothetical protein